MYLFKVAKLISKKYANIFLPHDDRDVDQERYELAGEREITDIDWADDFISEENNLSLRDIKLLLDKKRDEYEG